MEWDTNESQENKNIPQKIDFGNIQFLCHFRSFNCCVSETKNPQNGTVLNANGINYRPSFTLNGNEFKIKPRRWEKIANCIAMLFLIWEFVTILQRLPQKVSDFLLFFGLLFDALNYFRMIYFAYSGCQLLLSESVRKVCTFFHCHYWRAVLIAVLSVNCY